MKRRCTIVVCLEQIWVLQHPSTRFSIRIYIVTLTHFPKLYRLVLQQTTALDHSRLQLQLSQTYSPVHHVFNNTIPIQNINLWSVEMKKANRTVTSGQSEITIRSPFSTRWLRFQKIVRGTKFLQTCPGPRTS